MEKKMPSNNNKRKNDFNVYRKYVFMPPSSYNLHKISRK